MANVCYLDSCIPKLFARSQKVIFRIASVGPGGNKVDILSLVFLHDNVLRKIKIEKKVKINLLCNKAHNDISGGTRIFNIGMYVDSNAQKDPPKTLPEKTSISEQQR